MADERTQDGMGRDAAHGGRDGATSGGSVGRNPGRSGDDLLETGAESGRDRSAPDGADLPRGTDEHAEPDAGTRRAGQRRAPADDDDAVDPDVLPEVRRRDPID